MTTLLIKDLAMTEELGRAAMASVTGGTGKKLMYGGDYWLGHVSQDKFSFNAEQLLAQDQNTVVNNGNNAAFVHGIDAHVNPTQKGANTINFGGLL